MYSDIGRFTFDPELRQTTTGKSVCKFCLAVTRPYVKDKTDFFNFTAWDKTAETICRYFKKGSQIYVVGHLTSEKYEKDGKTQTSVGIEVEYIKFIDSRADSSPHKPISEQGGINTPSEPKTQQNAKFAVTEPQFETIESDDALPF